MNSWWPLESSHFCLMVRATTGHTHYFYFSWCWQEADTFAQQFNWRVFHLGLRKCKTTVLETLMWTILATWQRLHSERMDVLVAGWKMLVASYVYDLIKIAIWSNPDCYSNINKVVKMCVSLPLKQCSLWEGILTSQHKSTDLVHHILVSQPENRDKISNILAPYGFLFYLDDNKTINWMTTDIWPKASCWPVNGES